ncbi:MAG TPA: hypothetical protein VMG40_05160 [Bryobacteraceae bacterium]|nr:hypothetical protein [Bryobacteraceae bacterium]
MSTSLFRKRPFWIVLVGVAAVAGILSTSSGPEFAASWLRPLRVQKVQAVNLDLSPFVDANANPALHQMVSQMISDKVDVTLNETNRPAADRATATTMAGFPVELPDARKDTPRLIVGGRHELKMTVDRSRLQEILKAAGHPEIDVPASIDGATFSVRIAHAVHAQYGTCPSRVTASNAIAGQVIETAPSVGQFSDCIRLAQGPSPAITLPPGLDVQKLAEVGLQAAGMSSEQADQFFRTIDWKSVLTLSVPRQLRSYEQVKVNGVKGTLLTMAGRRGPGYTLLWAKSGMSYSLTGFGDPSGAVALADSLK